MSLCTGHAKILDLVKICVSTPFFSFVSLYLCLAFPLPTYLQYQSSAFDERCDEDVRERE